MPHIITDGQQIKRVLSRGVVEVIVEQQLREMLLQASKPLRLKMGFDPTRPDIHLGHVVGLRKLRQFQELGHQVILIVGDWTAQIGDPSGQSATRPMLTAEEVRANAETYLQQFFKVVDRERAQTVWQSEWFGKFTLANVIELTSKFTVAQFLAREDFKKRFEAEKPIAITELLYPLLQAYDSVVIQADVEFGGVDQKFNLLVGRELQAKVGQKPQQCVLMPLLVGTDGAQKMSKSLGNYIGVTDPPNDMYGKVMSLPDTLMMDYFELLTDVPDEEVGEMRSQLQRSASGGVNPMEIKKRLAREIVAIFHGWAQANAAEKDFEAKFQRQLVPDDIPIYPLTFGFLAKHNEVLTKRYGVAGFLSSPENLTATVDAIGVLVESGLAPSRSEALRLVAQGAVEVDGQRLEKEPPTMTLRPGTVVRVGKRRFLRFERKADS